MERYKQLFKKLTMKNEVAFVPFIIMGDPNFNLSLKIIDTLILSGADALELGFPYSDPIADGITIQKANLRARNAKISFCKCFEFIKIIRKKYLNIPIGLLIYANLIFSNGINNFYRNCSTLGVDSVLVADLPIEESLEFRNSALSNKISQVFICPPNPYKDIINKIIDYSKSYVYLLSREGVTGIDNMEKMKIPPKNLIEYIHKNGNIPILQGFGISTPCQVKNLIQVGISGIIVGSAIIKIIEENIINSSLMLRKLSCFTKKMKKATYK